MLTDLILLAAEQHKILGLRVQPGSEAGFRVHIWVGPNLGERIEWFADFPADHDRVTAIDEVAERVVSCCRQNDDSTPGASGAFAWGVAAETDVMERPA